LPIGNFELPIDISATHTMTIAKFELPIGVLRQAISKDSILQSFLKPPLSQ
jgi:hypothetical protein